MVLSNGHFIITGKSIIDGMRFSECLDPLQYIRRNKGTGGRYRVIGGILFSSPLEVCWQFLSSYGYPHLVSG